MRLDLLIPGLPAKADHFLFGICSILLLRDDSRTILFDTGPFRVRERLVGALARHGLAPADVDTVFLSHLHWDHVENLDLFPHAEVIAPRAEYDYAAAPRAGDWGTPPYVREILAGMRLHLLEDRAQDVFPGVATLPLPGHSVGLLGLVLDVEGERVVLPSDALWSARDAMRGKPDVAFFDPVRGQASLAAALAAGTLYYPGHDRPFRLEAGRVVYLEDCAYELRVSLQPYGPDLVTGFSTVR